MTRKSATPDIGSLRRSLTRRSGSISGSRSAFVTFEDLLAERGIVISYELTFAASDRFSHEIRDAPPRFEGMASCDGHQFDPCIPHHAVPTNRGGFRVDRNPRNAGGLVGRSVGCEPNSDCSPAFCA